MSSVVHMGQLALAAGICTFDVIFFTGIFGDRIQFTAAALLVIVMAISIGLGRRRGFCSGCAATRPHSPRALA